MNIVQRSLKLIFWWIYNNNNNNNNIIIISMNCCAQIPCVYVQMRMYLSIIQLKTNQNVIINYFDRNII